jgi:hypothetical protein
MLAWLTLLTGLSASLLFGATSATPVQISSVELQDNGNAQDLVCLPSVLLDRTVLFTLY